MIEKIATNILAVFGLLLIIISDLCLENIAKRGFMKPVLSKGWVRMTFSYLIGITLLILIINLFVLYSF